jgi:hypothetical protein
VGARKQTRRRSDRDARAKWLPAPFPDIHTPSGRNGAF